MHSLLIFSLFNLLCDTLNNIPNYHDYHDTSIKHGKGKKTDSEKLLCHEKFI